MANVIELIARWQDQGVEQGLRKTSGELAGMSRAAGLLTNALGTAAGVGAIASVMVLSRALGELARAPFAAAQSLAKLTDEIKAGTATSVEAQERYRELAQVVGEDGVRAFEKLAEKQKEADEGWRKLTARAAQSTVGLQSAWQNMLINLSRGEVPLGGLFGEPRSDYDRGPQVQGPQATEQQLEYARRLGQIAEEERRALERQTEARRKANEERQRELVLKREWQYNYDRTGIGEYGPQTASDYLQSILRPWEPPPRRSRQGEGLAGTVYDFSGGANIQETAALAEQAATSVASNLAAMARNFATNLQSLGSLVRGFFVSLASDVVGILGQMGLGSLLGVLGTALGGPIGGFLGTVGGKLIGKHSAATPRGAGAGTVVFQGINTRDAYMSFVRGELGEAMDLRQLRAEVA